MSIQMSFVFFCLVLEMALVSLLVLPLPFKVRKVVVNISDILINSTHYRVIIGFLAFIISLMFMDSLRRANSYYNRKGAADEPLYLNPFELAMRNYNQRNMYITGLVLYLGLCVPTIVSILKKLIKHRTKLENASKKPVVSDVAEVENLKKVLASKEADVETLKKQIKNLGDAYNKLADLLGPVQSSDKKKD